MIKIYRICAKYEFGKTTLRSAPRLSFKEAVRSIKRIARRNSLRGESVEVWVEDNDFREIPGTRQKVEVVK